MSTFSKFVTPDASSESSQDLIAAASACLDRFTDAFNACDLDGMDAQLHFPHVMFSGAEQLVWDAPGKHPVDFFDRLKSTGWAETRYEDKNPVLVSASKVHFVVEYTRRDRQGVVLSSHTNLWIATRIRDEWGIAVRSY
jgi:hypothetical protein